MHEHTDPYDQPSNTHAYTFLCLSPSPSPSLQNHRQPFQGSADNLLTMGQSLRLLW